MPLGVPAVSASNPYSGGTPSNARSLWLMADNSLRHEYTLFPALSNGPNPSSEDPRRPMSNILTPQPQEPGAFAGLFVLSDATDRGYAFASPTTGGCYSLNIRSVAIDLRTVTPSTFVAGGTAMARHVQARIRAGLLAAGEPDSDSFNVSYSTTTYKFTISSTSGAFTLWTKVLDSTSALNMMGFTSSASTYTLGASYTAEEARFHSDDWLIMRLDPSIFGPPGTSAEFVRWRWLWQVENTFAGESNFVASAKGTNLRLDLDATGLVNVDISAVPYTGSMSAYVAALKAAVLAAAPADFGFNITWDAGAARITVDNGGAGTSLIVSGDPVSAWPRLGFPATQTFGFMAATAPNAPRDPHQSARMVLYIGASVAALTEQPDSAFTEGANKFTLTYDATALASTLARPSYVGRSSGAQWRRGGLDSQRSRYWVADIADAIGTYLDAPTAIYVRLKVVDPNRATPLSIGALGFSAGWYPSINAAATHLGHEDRSTLQESVGGSLLPTPEMTRRATQYSWGAQNPLSARDAAFLDSLLGAEIGGEEAADWLAGNRRPIFLIDPTYVPDEATTGPAKLAAGAVYGFATWKPLEMGGRLAAGRRTGSIDVVEAR